MCQVDSIPPPPTTTNHPFSAALGNRFSKHFGFCAFLLCIFFQEKKGFLFLLFAEIKTRQRRRRDTHEKMQSFFLSPLSSPVSEFIFSLLFSQSRLAPSRLFIAPSKHCISIVWPFILPPSHNLLVF